jgi:hypothetical protein
MARIRSIKPDFWRDEKIASLKNQRVAFFFIGLWNFSDDQGKFPLSPKALALQMPIFRSKDVACYLKQLSEIGLIQVSECKKWGLVVGWRHQKIDRPILPKVKNEEIQWVPISDSSSPRDSSSSARRKDRIGKDRIGEDGITSEGVQTTKLKSVEKTFGSSVARPASSETWDAYRAAYKNRYREEPVRNATVNSQLAQFVKRIPESEAPLVAEFYLTHNDAFYVKQLHPVGLMLKDAEALRTQWARGRAITGSDARTVERMQTNANSFSVFANLDRGK